ncbi:hypothetical protein PPL_01955 [Heterostelium album PN500]|uniref:ParB/Sulfiredoxin domain-containing protein n=1 Tax=Heterostelium pallidum (strain ATCC 26659 / Pp 5 / PN500) TaxID=670386 RepID=D3B0Y8_HETP5|nr:hypothetical protein PPL_01955 [Heterostelium album PN500]EFA84962.1 hypothetical protein PPL_01955 [Heterostelium album PN500]|eukprot:XP_020437072.1 hypothetical protein PPL_01955 [Heterostelium album PN500]
MCKFSSGCGTSDSKSCRKCGAKLCKGCSRSLITGAAPPSGNSAQCPQYKITFKRYKFFKVIVMIMMGSRLNRVLCYEIDRLRPTQCAAGMKHVQRKVNELKTLKEEKGADKVIEFLYGHPAPVILKQNDIYLIDNHHLCRALYELKGEFFEDLDFSKYDKDFDGKVSGDPKCFVKVVSDLTDKQTMQEFWEKMEEERWVHPYDHNGNGPLPHHEIPSHIKDLKDDIWRSVAALVKIQGGFKKSMVPYAEFRWANFFRGELQSDCDLPFEELVDKSMKLSKSSKAKELPGFTGL